MRKPPLLRNAARAAPWATLAILVTLVVLPVRADEDCAVCHENLAKSFETTIHGRIEAFETAGVTTGCVTCHGDGIEHMESGGDPSLIRGLGEEADLDEVTEVCLGCHRSDKLHDWVGSTHSLNDVHCADCHSVHATEPKRDPEVCWECHQDVRAQFEYPSHHPLREGHMTCSSCHQPHGSSVGNLVNEERPQDLCYGCHTHLQGPFLFEHEPVFEGCDTCHEPHGAVANNLLTQNEPFLCLQCHETHFHAGLEADTEEYVEGIPRFAYDPTFDPDTPRPTYPDGVPNPWGAKGYQRAFTTKCTQCHTAVHGTDLPSQTTTGFGQGLLR